MIHSDSLDTFSTTDCVIVVTLFHSSIKLQSNNGCSSRIIICNARDCVVTHCVNPTTLNEIALDKQKDKQGGNSITHKLTVKRNSIT